MQITEAMADIVANPIILIDIHGRIKLFNRAAEKTFGYKAEEVLGKNVKIIMPEPYRSSHNDYLKEYLQTGKAKIIGTGREVVALRKNGEIFPMELAVNELSLLGERNFAGSIVDISGWRNAQAELTAAKEDAESANRTKSKFLDIISHELRTPLTVILGNTPLLTDTGDLPDEVEIAEIANDIEKDAIHLLSIINDLLDISKIEAGKMTIVRKTIGIVEFVNAVVSEFRRKISVKGITINVSCDDINIEADSLRLKQILYNLISNALKFTDKGTISIRGRKDGERVLFEVEDTGCGIPAADMARIFDAFHQVDSSDSRATSGTGLGLAITEKLVKLLGGEIGVKSVVGKGSKFYFFIPVTDKGSVK